MIKEPVNEYVKLLYPQMPEESKLLVVAPNLDEKRWEIQKENKDVAAPYRDMKLAPDRYTKLKLGQNLIWAGENGTMVKLVASNWDDAAEKLQEVNMV